MLSQRKGGGDKICEDPEIKQGYTAPGNLSLFLFQAILVFVKWLVWLYLRRTLQLYSQTETGFEWGGSLGAPV